MHEERKENRKHIQSKAQTYAFDTHHNNDITYFGGPRLQAVGIATDEESHFRITEGNFPAKEKSKSKFLWESKRINTRPGCHRDVKEGMNHAVSVSSEIMYSAHIYRIPSRAINTPQTSSSHQPNSRSPENSMLASAPFLSRAAPDADASWGERQNPALGLVPLLHPASERASPAGDSPSRHVHRLDALPLKTERLGVRGTERSPAEKHDITCAGRGGVGRGDCIRAIGRAEERRGNASVFID